MQSNLPHIDLIFGIDRSDNRNNFQASALVDTAAAINTASFDDIFALAEAFPHLVHSVYTTKQYAPLCLSCIVKTDSTIVTSDLKHVFECKLPYKTAEGDPCTIMFVAGKDVSVNLILSLPFLKATRSNIDLGDGVVESNLLDITPWHITFKSALLLIPKVAIAEIPINGEDYSTFLTDLAAIKTVMMTDSSPVNVPTVDSAWKKRKVQEHSVSFNDFTNSGADIPNPNSTAIIPFTGNICNENIGMFDQNEPNNQE
mmetsp:Transcript_16808/g.35204  ORF Transcript_16808/g.35204 Transcript_16808/m.35204 type:complete len:257 (-) Transcript_16808:119-889(-)